MEKSKALDGPGRYEPTRHGTTSISQARDAAIKTADHDGVKQLVIPEVTGGILSVETARSGPSKPCLTRWNITGGIVASAPGIHPGKPAFLGSYLPRCPGSGPSLDAPPALNSERMPSIFSTAGGASMFKGLSVTSFRNRWANRLLVEPW